MLITTSIANFFTYQHEARLFAPSFDQRGFDRCILLWPWWIETEAADTEKRAPRRPTPDLLPHTLVVGFDMQCWLATCAFGITLFSDSSIAR